MLQTMRNNAQGMFAKIIMGFLVIVFGLWGVESIVSIGGGEAAAIVVDGEKITEFDIERAVESQRANLSRQFGDQFNADLFNDGFLRQAAIEQLVNERISIIQAQKLGLTASKRQLDEVIVQEPAFQQNGRFDAEQFRDVLRMNGMSPTDFRNALTNDLVINQAQAGFALTGFATEFEAQVKGMLDSEERTFKYIEITTDSLINKVKLSDDDIAAAYELQKKNFRTPEVASVRYIEIKLNDVAATQSVSDEELYQAYGDYKKRQAITEQRHASHILLELDSRSLKEAKNLAESLKQRIDAGEDFAALAKEYSDDIGTKAIGGDLGFSPRGSNVEAFDTALYALEEGKVSEPVETEFGVHLIRADKVVAADVQPFDVMRDELDQEVRLAKAQVEYQSKIIDMSDAAFGAQSLDELASQLGLSIQETALFSRDQGEGIAANHYVRDAAYSENVLFNQELSPMVELSNSAVVLAIKEHKEESYQPLSEVQEQVVSVLKQQRAFEMAKEQAEQAAKASDTQWKIATSTYGHVSDVASAIQARAFAMNKDQVETLATASGYAAIKLTNITNTNWSDVAVDNGTAESIRLENGRADLFGYQNWSKEVTSVKRK